MGITQVLILRGYVGLFVIYSNEISDIRDAVRLCYKLASNSPCIIGHVIEENKRFVGVELDEGLKDNYFSNHLGNEYQDFKNVKKADVNNYKYRFFCNDWEKSTFKGRSRML